MIVLRYLYVLALVVWVGGMLALGGVAAPSVFAVLSAHEAAGTGLALAVFADMLGVFHRIAYACGATMLATLAGMRVLGPKPVQFNVRAAIVALMLATALYTGLVASDDLAGQPQLAGAAGLAAHDLRHASLHRLHNILLALLLVNVAGGLSLLYWEARE